MESAHLPNKSAIKKVRDLIKEKKVNQAKEKLEKVIKYYPKNAQALYLLGIINAELGAISKGIRLLQKAINLESDKAEYLYDLAVIMQSIGNKNEAVSHYKKAIAINSNLFQAYYNIGNIYARQNKIQKSIDAYKKAISINPKFVSAHNNLGNVLKANRQIAEALYMYQDAILINPNYVPAYNNIGLILHEQGKSDKAIRLLKKALVRNSHCPKIANNLANAYQSTQRYKEAIKLYKRILEKNPKHVFAYNNLGLTYQKMGKNKKALSCYKKILKIAPDFADIYNNMGNLYQRVGNLEEALKHYKQAIKKRPKYHQALFNISTIHFLRGEYKKAWRYYEARLMFPNAMAREKKYLSIKNASKWKGENLKGKTIFVYSEKGYENSIQFVRYLPLLKERKKAFKILFEPQPALKELFKTSDLKAEVLPPYLEKDEKFVYDFYIPLLSLPYHFQTTIHNIPKIKGYLKADSKKVKEYEKKYFQTKKLKVGILWQEFKGDSKDQQRCIVLKKFLPIFSKNIQIYSLQKGPEEKQLLKLPKRYKAIALGKTFRDFSDIAAAITNLDLVIAVNSSVAHLAAALGGKTWILIPSISDWIWDLRNSESIWYKSVKLFRQKKANDWEHLFEEVSLGLREIL